MKLGEKNVGMIDRVIRIIVGFAIIGYGVVSLSVPLNAVAFLLGLAILLTGGVGYCKLYDVLGMSTAPKAAKAAPAAPPPAPAKSRKKK